MHFSDCKKSQVIQGLVSDYFGGVLVNRDVPFGNKIS